MENTQNPLKENPLNTAFVVNCVVAVALIVVVHHTPTSHGSFQVKKLQVTSKRVIPDPVILSVNDIVCWMWPRGTRSSIQPFSEEQNLEENSDVTFSKRYENYQNYVLIVSHYFSAKL